MFDFSLIYILITAAGLQKLVCRNFVWFLRENKHLYNFVFIQTF